MRKTQKTDISKKHRWLGGLLLAALLIAGAAWAGQIVLARSSAANAAQVSPLHPTFALLDAGGQPVVESGNPVSTIQTCGSCHDTQFIASHSSHTSAGLDELTAPGETASQRAWDISSGYFGRWDPITYRYLSPEGDERIDLGTAAWIMEYGSRHAGGGPATTSRDGQPLDQLIYSSTSPETNIVDPATGELTPWDWPESGTVEMNCFLCHTPDPDNGARTQALEVGDFKWASTATLLGTGIVEQAGDGYQWVADAFQADGELKPELVTIQDPTNQNCGLCHGLVHDETDEPLVLTGCSAGIDRTGTSGQILSPERISESGTNLAGKGTLDYPWDIHAERQVSCTDCHYSLNNPVYYQETDDSRPDHLSFDPRRLEISEYLLKPLHQFAGSQSAQGTLASDTADTMRSCDTCHNIQATHNWLPYKERHMDTVSCETCHVPKMNSTAYQQYDWTIIKPDNTPQSECRGIDGPNGAISSLISGFEPALLPRIKGEASSQIAPYNLVTSWYWVSGDPERPVRLQDLSRAFLDGETYHADIVTTFDQDGDRKLGAEELVIDSPEKETVVASHLEGLGLENPHIKGEIQPYSINHNIVAGDWATRDCQTCHNGDSRLSQPFKLASYIPGGVLPEFVKDSGAAAAGEVYRNERGELYYQPDTGDADLYILGHNRVAWVDLLGSLMFAGVLLGVGAHGTLRYLAAARRPRHAPEIERVYMYTIYERFWHWLQTFTILGLLFTGLVIHKPDTFGIFSFRGIVIVHNILAAILLINAFLSLFYHLASGEIKQFVPRPYGFIDDAIAQALFYLRGIFRGEPHPFQKTPRKKLNPLQQITYFAILNVLLPLQVITGALMWGAQRWPDLAARLGGLPFLAPFHTLIAWSFAAFIVMHVYLTTTGHAAFAGIRSMMVGWDELEAPQTPAQEETPA